MKTSLAKQFFLSKLCFRTFSFKTQAEYVFVVGLLLSSFGCQKVPGTACLQNNVLEQEQEAELDRIEFQ